MYQNVTYIALPVKIESPHGDPMAPKGTDILSPGQCRAARAWLHWSARELADRAKVSRMTVQRFENEGGVAIAATVQQIKSAMESAGIVFPDLETVRFPSNSRPPRKPAKAPEDSDTPESN